MLKVYVKSKEQLDYLYNNSALTIVGIKLTSIPDFIKWVDEVAGLKEETAYVISGKIMNEVYKLCGTKAYKDNLTIVSIPLDVVKDVHKLLVSRFSVGAKWFDDIVDNNRR